MQDVHPIGVIPTGGGGRVFGDRRMRPHHHHQALKCPRCDSLNTKFCYYNNYNLSQPRHFCKNCRRYWTKGGVLRNVPVGGGCRKTKRSKPKPKTPSSPSSALKPPNSLSSSESSTTTNSAIIGGGAGGDGGGAVFQISESENFGINVQLDPLMQSNHHTHHQISDQMMFPTEIGGFGSLITNSTDPLGLVGAAETAAAFHQFMQAQEGGMLDPTVRIDDMLHSRESNGGLDSLDWQGSIDQSNGGIGLFDFVPSTDQQSYWSQTTSSHHHLLPQWSDHTNSVSFFLDNQSPSIFFPN